VNLGNEKNEDIELLTVWSDPKGYAFNFKSSSVPEWVSGIFFLSKHDIFPLYYRLGGLSKSRGSVIPTLNKSVKEARLWAPYFFAAIYYESKCSHTPEEIRNGKIINCKCYKLACKLVEDVEYVSKRGKNYRMRLKL